MEIIRANNMEEDLYSIKYDYVSVSHGKYEDILALAEWYENSNEEINTWKFSEFRDSFLLCASLTTKDSLILYVITFYLMNSAINNVIYNYPIMLEHKNKDNVFNENTYIE